MSTTELSTPATTNAQTSDPALKVTIRRVLRFPRERVFAAWTTPEQMQQWRSPVGWTVPKIEADVRTGGIYRIYMRGTPAGQSQEVEGHFEGKFLEVRPYDLVCFTSRANWIPDQETLVTVRLSDVEGGTLLELTDENFLQAATAAQHSLGWNTGLDKLEAKLVEWVVA